jgi:hypothetical protein
MMLRAKRSAAIKGNTDGLACTVRGKCPASLSVKADAPNALRELAVHKLANAAFAAGLTEHVVLFATARLLATETRIITERFESSATDFPAGSDAGFRSITMQALHGHYTMRELGFEPGLRSSTVLVRHDADAPETWRFACGGTEFHTPSCGILACVADFGAAPARGPLAFLGDIATIAAERGVTGSFVRALAGVLGRGTTDIPRILAIFSATAD